jgi:indole-3-acetate monooxygenase
MKTTRTLDRVRELAPTISRRSAEIENARRLPLDLVSDLVAAGCFRMLAPAAYGGDELTRRQACEVLEELSCADGSTGWTTMIGSESPLLFSLLPKTTFDVIYADGPDVIGAGALSPHAQAVPVDGGYCLSGQWPFGSGCQHASWLLGQSIVLNDGRPHLLPNGIPDMRVAVFPAEQAEILDTWHVAGLQGTVVTIFVCTTPIVPKSARSASSPALQRWTTPRMRFRHSCNSHWVLPPSLLASVVARSRTSRS